MKKVKKQILVALFLNVQILHNSSILTDKRNITFPRPTPLVAEKIFLNLLFVQKVMRDAGLLPMTFLAKIRTLNFSPLETFTRSNIP